MSITTALLFVASTSLAAGEVATDAQPSEPDSAAAIRFGVKAQAGGRYDDVRMCVATPAGVKGGTTLEISIYLAVPLAGGKTLSFILPVMRPLLFGAAFGMMQFEPDVVLTLRWETGWDFDLIYGPLLGLSLHYGPDYTAGPDDGDEIPAFFAWGPRLGAYVAVDLSKLSGLDLQIGLAPTVSPLFSAGDPDNHNGWVAGVVLDAQLGLLGGD